MPTLRKTRRWKNVEGTFTTTIGPTEDGVWVDENGVAIAFCHDVLNALFPNVKGMVDCEITFKSDGFDIPARGFDPPEYEDNREMVEVDVEGKEMPKDIADNIFDHFLPRISKVELRTN